MGHLLAEIKAHQETMKALMDVSPEKMKPCRKVMKTWLDRMEAYPEKSEASQEKIEDVVEGYEEAP
jgi:hypothetical protein